MSPHKRLGGRRVNRRTPAKATKAFRGVRHNGIDTHEPLDTLVVDHEATILALGRVAQVGQNPPAAIGLVACNEVCANGFHQKRILHGTQRGRMFAPLIVAAAWRLQHLAQCRHRVVLLE